jgi:hypothetical protein
MRYEGVASAFAEDKKFKNAIGQRSTIAPSSSFLDTLLQDQADIFA